MKTALIHLLVLAAAASHAAYGYTISPLPSNRRKSRVMPSGKSQTDVIEPTKAIKQAIEATKSFGATSSKARIAWEVVEKIEMPRKRSSKRSKKKLLGGVVADNGGAEEKSEIMPMVIDEATFGVVEDNMSDLKVLLDDEMAKVRHLKNMANKIKVSCSYIPSVISYQSFSIILLTNVYENRN